MKEKVNTYLAILFITIAGSGAALLIIHVATDNMLTQNVQGNEANYFLLQQSILTSK